MRFKCIISLVIRRALCADCNDWLFQELRGKVDTPHFLECSQYCGLCEKDTPHFQIKRYPDPFRPISVIFG
uniref:Putative secreted protein n=1 Tax=Ixodes ricinus TaxID=34613 RepID=A0A147BBB5_IXORI